MLDCNRIMEYYHNFGFPPIPSTNQWTSNVSAIKFMVCSIESNVLLCGKKLVSRLPGGQLHSSFVCKQCSWMSKQNIPNSAVIFTL